MIQDPQEYVRRYLAVWHDPDGHRRRSEIEAVWVPEGAHYSANIAAQGYDELEDRVKGAYERWVVEEGCIFRLAGDIHCHHGVLMFPWEMASAEGSEVFTKGLDFHTLTPEGRLRAAHFFVVQ